MKNKYAKFQVFFLIGFSIFSIFFLMYKNIYKISVPYFNFTQAQIVSNIEVDNDKISKLALKFDDIYYPYNTKIDRLRLVNTDFMLKNQNHLSYNLVFNMRELNKDKNVLKKPIKKMSFAIQRGAENDVLNAIDNFHIAIGKKQYYFSSRDIASWDKTSDYICLNKDCSNKAEVTLFNFPQEIKKMCGEYYNFKGFLAAFTICFLSLFFAPKFYILPYSLLLLALFMYCKNKEQFDFKFNIKNIHLISLLLIFLLGVLIRCTLLFYDPLWYDEVYILAIVANPLDSLKSVFLDAGNPPAFFMLSEIWSKIFGTNVYSARILPLILGILSLFTTYICAKALTKSEKIALVALFLTAISYANITYAQELRCFIFLLFLIPILTIYLFRVVEKSDFKNNAIYTILASIIANTHIYGALLIFSNYVYGAFEIYKNAENKWRKILNFTISNVVAAFSLLPYVFVTMLSNSFKDDFNTWLPPLSFTLCKNILKFYFGNRYLFLVFVLASLLAFISIFIYKKCKNEEKIFKMNEKFMAEPSVDIQKTMYYSAFVAFFVFLISCIITLIKPAMFIRYYLVLYPIFTIFCAALISLPYKFKFKEFFVVFLFFVFSIYSGFFDLDERKGVNGESIIQFTIEDSKRFHDKGYQIYGVITDYEKYLPFYSRELSKAPYVNWIIHRANNTKISIGDTITPLIKDGKAKVIYFNCFGLALKKSDRTIFEHEKITSYKLPERLTNLRLILDEGEK